MEKAKVYFTKDLSKEGLVKVYDALGKELVGKVAVKLHSGEKGNQNFLKPEFVQELVHRVHGTVVECNTAYEGARNTTERHQELMKEHGWSKYFQVDIMDSDGDMVLEIPEGLKIKKNYVGKNLENYDSMLVLSHFKGHPMGGYGGALKQLSIGVASSVGKRYIHCVGKENGTYEDMFHVNQLDFLASMADAASSVVKYFKGNLAFVNVMANMSVDCDCCAVAEDPCMKDIGILASLDPVAIDKACLDIVYQSTDPGRDHMVERIERQHGTNIIDDAVQLGIGTNEYELILID
ncbi:putative uncharacterized protein [Mycoplasma sp. CAG:776]|nr:putative uncharacterized protein [Mycoplasma sp. CAG:776]